MNKYLKSFIKIYSKLSMIVLYSIGGGCIISITFYAKLFNDNTVFQLIWYFFIIGLPIVLLSFLIYYLNDKLSTKKGDKYE